MRLGYASNSLQSLSLPKALEAMSQAGFPAAEILMDTPHWRPGPQAGQVAALRKILLSTGLTLNNLNANDSRLLGTPQLPEPRPLHPDDSVRRRLLEWHGELLRVAADLGAPCLSIATGPRPAQIPAPEAEDILRFHLDPLLKVAENLGVLLAIEFEPGHHWDSWASLQDVLREFNHPLLGCNFDIGHAACAEEALPETLVAALPCVRNIHFEDIKGNLHEHLVPGRGDLPLAKILSSLTDKGYEGGVTVELYNHSSRGPEALRETRAWFLDHAPALLRSQAASR